MVFFLIHFNFSVCYGVKQGGVLSPMLFCVYVGGLLQRLASSKIGCNFGMIYVGVLAYADDIVLLSQTASAVRACSCQYVMIMPMNTNVISQSLQGTKLHQNSMRTKALPELVRDFIYSVGCSISERWRLKGDWLRTFHPLLCEIRGNGRNDWVNWTSSTWAQHLIYFFRVPLCGLGDWTFDGKRTSGGLNIRHALSDSGSYVSRWTHTCQISADVSDSSLECLCCRSYKFLSWRWISLSTFSVGAVSFAHDVSRYDLQRCSAVVFHGKLSTCLYTRWANSDT